MTILITAAKETMPDPDLEIRGRGWGEGGGGGAVPKKFFGIFGPQFGLNIRGGGGSGPPLDPPMNRKASGLRCKFATKLMTCSPVLLFSFHQELINAQVAGLGTSNAERKPRGRCYAGIGCTNSG